MTYQERFRVMKGTREGLPVVLSVDAGLTALREQWRARPWFLTISIPLAEPNEEGWCGPEEGERLNDLEDALLSALPPSDYLFMGRMTWRGVRELWLYAADEADALARLNEAFGAVSTPQQELTVTARFDPDWSEYRDLVGDSE
jgi:Family of unknown function (DUF695)